jgi:hypothetical protein
MSRAALRLLVCIVLATILHLAVACMQSLDWADAQRVPWHIGYVRLFWGFSAYAFAGFAGLYALLLYALFVALRTARRMLLYGRGVGRLQRRRCTACGYPVGTGRVCTECGRPPHELPASTVRSLVS